MAGKRIRSRNSHNSIPVTNLSNRTAPQTANVTNTAGPRVPDDLLSLTKEQLKAECRRRGQKTTGTKVELVCLVQCISFLSLFIYALSFLCMAFIVFIFHVIVTANNDCKILYVAITMFYFYALRQINCML